ncbi:hypothetical protein AAG906_005262 [Vitis piasezkii]
METSPLAVESFSYSWLINVKSSLDGLGSPLRTSLDISDEATSKGKDYNVLKSQRLMDEAQNFNFDVPTSQSSVALIHADEVFSNGFIVPMFIDPSKKEALDTSHSLSSVPVSSLPSRPGIPAVGIHCSFFRKWQNHQRALRGKIGGSRKLRLGGSPQPSLQQSASSSVGDWCHMESSIHEAVLYCKRSIEK